MASFPLLARASTRTFVAFDMLAVNGRALVDEPIEQRRAHRHRG
jgi:ATP-dependent DNA ligase